MTHCQQLTSVQFSMVHIVSNQLLNSNLLLNTEIHWRVGPGDRLILWTAYLCDFWMKLRLSCCDALKYWGIELDPTVESIKPSNQSIQSIQSINQVNAINQSIKSMKSINQVSVMNRVQFLSLITQGLSYQVCDQWPLGLQQDTPSSGQIVQHNA